MILFNDSKSTNVWLKYVKNKLSNKDKNSSKISQKFFTQYNQNNKKNISDCSITKKFVIKYCCRNTDTSQYITKDKEKILNNWNEFNTFLRRKDINWFLVARYLCRFFDYNDFLKLPYWIITKNKKIVDSFYSCQLFFGHNNDYLDVHHNTYYYHGFEAHLPEILIVLCRSCHQKHHNKDFTQNTFKNTFKNKLFIYEYNDKLLNLNSNEKNVSVEKNILLELTNFKSEFHQAIYQSELIKLKSETLLKI